jgi:hypothetical protein
LQALASGAYKVVFFALGYTTQYYDDSASLAGATAVMVSAGETISGIDAVLQRTASKTTRTFTVPPPPVPLPITPVSVPLPKPQLKISLAKVFVAGSSAKGVQLACAGATCEGSIELTMQLAVKRREGHRTVSRKQTIVLAKGTFSIAAGQSSAVVLHLTAMGRRELAHVKHHPLRVKLALSLTGGAAQGQSVLVR